ncbi:calcium-binding protein [Streptomyces vietnamensis]|uniref:calcium-binding protein n=1 Tax=Streptomyces vietnamensis TaxID=362257 RepID=UPI0037A63C0F
MPVSILGRRRRAAVGTAAGLALVLWLPGVAVAAPGELDPGFGTGGTVRTDFGGQEAAYGMAVQGDGKFVLAGNAGPRFALARYTADGGLDTGFGTGGKVTTAFDSAAGARGAVELAGGGILAFGTVYVGTDGSDIALARYTSDGTLDTTFGTGGTVVTDAGDRFGGIEDAAVQADGKIVVAGGGGSSEGDFLVARYNPNGSLDTTFGTGGMVITDFGDKFDAARAVVLQSGGRILAVGGADQGEFGLARYTSNGSPDTTFGGGDGMVTTNFSGFDEAEGVALQPDGKIVAAGGGGFDFALARYNPDGSLDTGFGSGGRVTTDIGNYEFDSAFGGVVLQPDGRMVAAGSTGSGGGDFALARYNPDGSLDAGFGTGGKVVTHVSGAGDRAEGLAIRPNGRIVAAGSADFGGNGDFALAGYQGGSAPVDLTVSKTGPQTASLGDLVTHTVTVTNPSATLSAANVTLDDSLTGAGALVSATASQGDCAITATSAHCALGYLAPGAGVTVTVVAEPSAAGVVSDTATVASTDPDPSSGNNTATAQTTVDNAHGCTIVDTGGAGTIVGTGGDDVICALSGDDVINGGNGNDVIYSGSGNDMIDAANGTDTVDGGPGNDTLVGGNGNDTLTGGPGNDTLTGGSGDDTLITTDGVGGNDTANGGPGSDTCATDPGDNRISCP